MLAVQIDAPGAIPSLVIRRAPDPQPSPGEVVIEFLASSINPADVKIRTGSVVPAVGSYPFTLGYDLVGRVVDTDSEVQGFEVGDVVLAMSAVARNGRGTWSEYVCLPAEAVAHLGSEIEPAVAARLPLVGLTALQAVRRAAVAPGECVLVAGAVGAVGRMVVQLLLGCGAQVHGLVRRVDQVEQVPMHENVVGRAGMPEPGSMDVVIDASGGDFSPALRDGGRYVSLVPDQLPSREVLVQRAIDRSVLITRESGPGLAELVDLVRSGVIALQQPRTFTLNEIHTAHKEYEHNAQRNVVLVRSA